MKIKIKLNKYVSRDTLHKIKARYIILLGGRNNGKSFATKEDIIKNFLEMLKFLLKKRKDSMLLLI